MNKWYTQPPPDKNDRNQSRAIAAFQEEICEQLPI